MMNLNEELSSYKGRLKTFTNKWPFRTGSLSGHEMAKAGFYFRKGDTVKCYYCEKELEGWEENDVPYEEHKIHATYCPFVKMFPEPPNTVTVHQAIALERDKLILKIDKSFELWVSEFRASNSANVDKLFKEAAKN